MSVAIGTYIVQGETWKRYLNQLFNGYENENRCRKKNIYLSLVKLENKLFSVCNKLNDRFFFNLSRATAMKLPASSPNTLYKINQKRIELIRKFHPKSMLTFGD